jgi:hypothetical protein
MAHFVFNFSSGCREAAAALLRANMWSVADDEPLRDALAPRDLVLIYVAPQDGAFIGRAELATAAHTWTSFEAQDYPGDAPSGVVLTDVERWDRAVPMPMVLARVDPTGSNPVVQANAKDGFRAGVVRITHDEYDVAVAVSREYQRA